MAGRIGRLLAFMRAVFPAQPPRLLLSHAMAAPFAIA